MKGITHAPSLFAKHSDSVFGLELIGKLSSIHSNYPTLR
jgi:hypothetical protein